ncbi:hypothetical protein BV22DRAFT_1122622 [Leucogyrophana mollusca]|uniref:Uncharacterized protein n=1 Tax=Leucogyrophana mollusca TaxID=85980 RepID=A0ACB8B731_9AGAM|nr:hypothetical protein BV22DRAFT_1122622 [Leucogyrophana mollusca]
MSPTCVLKATWTLFPKLKDWNIAAVVFHGSQSDVWLGTSGVLRGAGPADNPPIARESCAQLWMCKTATAACGPFTVQVEATSMLGYTKKEWDFQMHCKTMSAACATRGLRVEVLPGRKRDPEIETLRLQPKAISCPEIESLRLQPKARKYRKPTAKAALMFCPRMPVIVPPSVVLCEATETGLVTIQSIESAASQVASFRATVTVFKARDGGDPRPNRDAGLLIPLQLEGLGASQKHEGYCQACTASPLDMLPGSVLGLLNRGDSEERVQVGRVELIVVFALSFVLVIPTAFSTPMQPTHCAPSTKGNKWDLRIYTGENCTSSTLVQEFWGGWDSAFMGHCVKLDIPRKKNKTPKVHSFAFTSQNKNYGIAFFGGMYRATWSFLIACTLN